VGYEHLHRTPHDEGPARRSLAPFDANGMNYFKALFDRGQDPERQE
jgi:hypothetical protein